jgi:drug/metabolite transporter (DMT)-like permease
VAASTTSTRSPRRSGAEHADARAGPAARRAAPLAVRPGLRRRGIEVRHRPGERRALGRSTAMSHRPLGGLLLLGTLTLLWGSNWPAMKLALHEIDPWIFRTVCLLVGGAGLLVLARASGQSLRVPPQERWPLAVVTFFNITTWHLCSAYGLTRIQAGRAAIIAYTMPLWTVVFGRLMVGERITRARTVALGLGLLGMVALVAPVARTLWDAPAGTLLMLFAAAGWAFGTVLTKSQAWTIPTAVLTGWQVLLGGVPIALGAAIRLAAAGATGPGLAPILPAAVAAIGTLGIPIVGLFSSALILGEPVGAGELLALILVVSGLAILFREVSGGGRDSAERARPVSAATRESR